MPQTRFALQKALELGHKIIIAVNKIDKPDANPEKVKQDLLEGGYAPDTPAPVVYRASWPDEKVIRCTLSQVPEVFKENGTAPALIIVGKVLAEENAQAVKSRLYAPDFSTGYREAKS